MGVLVGERMRETENERERDREREGGVKQMCQNCIPTMNMNTLWLCCRNKILPKLRPTKAFRDFWSPEAKFFRQFSKFIL